MPRKLRAKLIGGPAGGFVHKTKGHLRPAGLFVPLNGQFHWYEHKQGLEYEYVRTEDESPVMAEAEQAKS